MFFYQINEISHSLRKIEILPVNGAKGGFGVIPVQAEKCPSLMGKSDIILKEGETESCLNQIEYGSLFCYCLLYTSRCV